MKELILSEYSSKYGNAALIIIPPIECPIKLILLYFKQFNFIDKSCKKLTFQELISTIKHIILLRLQGF